MNAKHTPGPWIQEILRSRRTEITGGNGSFVAAVITPADARLIAKAPDMRGLLAEALAETDILDDDPDAPVNGADLVAWFTDWRRRVKTVL